MGGLTVALLVLQGCGGAPDEQSTVGIGLAALTNGAADTGDAAVVALVDPGGAVRCSGALIASQWILTAAHCLATPGAAAPRIYLGPTPTVAGSGSELIAAKSGLAAPTYDADTGEDDVALIPLRDPVDVTPLPLLELREGAPLPGEPLRLVGFGRDPDHEGDSFTKQTGRTAIDEVHSSWFTFHANPAQTCEGDSGGPALIERAGQELVAGVHSGGDVACARYGRDVRIDPLIDGFVVPTLALGVGGYDGGCSLGSSQHGGDGSLGAPPPRSVDPLVQALVFAISAFRRRVSKPRLRSRS